MFMGAKKEMAKELRLLVPVYDSVNDAATIECHSHFHVQPTATVSTRRPISLDA